MTDETNEEIIKEEVPETIGIEVGEEVKQEDGLV